MRWYVFFLAIFLTVAIGVAYSWRSIERTVDDIQAYQTKRLLPEDTP